MQGTDVDLYCSVISSNPGNFSLTTTNTSGDSTNIVLWQNSTTVIYSLTNATCANNGFFNCSANNGIAVTNFSHWAFFGGKKNLPIKKFTKKIKYVPLTHDLHVLACAYTCRYVIFSVMLFLHFFPPIRTGIPSKVTVDPTIQEVSGYLVVNLIVTDSSCAPATALDVLVGGLENSETTINFTQPILPEEAVVFPQVVSTSVEKLNLGSYTLIVNAENMLGSTRVLSSIFYYPLVTPCKLVHAVLCSPYINYCRTLNAFVCACVVKFLYLIVEMLALHLVL